MSLEEERINREALELHEQYKGKVAIAAKAPLRNMRDLALAYSPGVAEPCKRIHENPEDVYRYTAKGNLVAVVSDGTAVLGLGDIGPEAAMPVMEGKAVLFKVFAGVDGFPICLATKSVDEIVQTVKLLAPTFGGVNLEDIAAPRCFEIEERLIKELQIPVFHDDQHGTAIVVAAGLINAVKRIGKTLGDLKVVVNGAGASGVAVSKLIMDMGVNDLILCDTTGALYVGRSKNMNPYKASMAARTNPRKVEGTLADAVVGADLFIGLSKAGALSVEMLKSMAPEPIIFAMANPVPEIWPEDAIAAGAAIVGTGRSDYPNQINNVLAFPGVFRGALDVQATCINEAMKRAAADAIASLISAEELTQGIVIPNTFDTRVAPAVAAAVAQAAIETGVARVPVDPAKVAENCRLMTALPPSSIDSVAD
jgi:malate dehydrogenase (oxaloacetate-decarboxylating)